MKKGVMVTMTPFPKGGIGKKDQRARVDPAPKL